MELVALVRLASVAHKEEVEGQQELHSDVPVEPKAMATEEAETVQGEPLVAKGAAEGAAEGEAAAGIWAENTGRRSRTTQLPRGYPSSRRSQTCSSRGSWSPHKGSRSHTPVALTHSWSP